MDIRDIFEDHIIDIYMKNQDIFGEYAETIASEKAISSFLHDNNHMSITHKEDMKKAAKIFTENYVLASYFHSDKVMSTLPFFEMIFRDSYVVFDNNHTQFLRATSMTMKDGLEIMGMTDIDVKEDGKLELDVKKIVSYHEKKNSKAKNLHDSLSIKEYESIIEDTVYASFDASLAMMYLGDPIIQKRYDDFLQRRLETEKIKKNLAPGMQNFGTLYLGQQNKMIN